MSTVSTPILAENWDKGIGHSKRRKLHVNLWFFHDSFNHLKEKDGFISFPLKAKLFIGVLSLWGT